MAEIEYEVQLDEAGLEWLRVRIITAGGHVMNVAIQYETTIAGERAPVVRYDNAHGFAHRDLIDRKGRVTKEGLAGAPAPKIALDVGLRDVRSNWHRYRRYFLKDQE